MVSMTAGEDAFIVVRRVLLELLDAAESNIAGTIEDVDDEYLHQLRVALRQSRTVLRHARSLMPGETNQLEGEIRWFARVTGDARDLDVQTASWAKLVAPLKDAERAALEVVHRELQTNREAAHVLLETDLRSARARALRNEWRAWLTDDSKSPRLQLPIDAFVRQQVKHTQRRLVRDGKKIKPSTPASQVHELRKTAKELRYLFQCFAGLFDHDLLARHVAALKDFQDNLGAHQDADVQMHRLTELGSAIDARGELDSAAEAALSKLRKRVKRRRTRERSDFDERFRAYTRRKQRELFRDLVRSMP